MIDDDDPPPQRRPPDPSTPEGRIQGIHRRRYARLWGIDLDMPADDDYPGGEADFELTYKLMSFDHHKAEESVFGPIGGYNRDGRERRFSDELDLEEFAAAWRPPTMSEMIEMEIAERIAAERRARDPDPEARH